MLRMIAAAATLLMVTGNLFADVTVNGEGKVSVEPDVVHINVGVNTTDKSAVDALATNNKAVKELFAILEKEGVDKKDMQTINFAIGQVYHYDKENKLVLDGYQVSNHLKVCIRKLDTVGGLLDKLVKSGANRINSVTYGLNDPTKALDEARVAAVKDAKRRAELYAKTADVRLGKVITISENVTRPIPITRSYSAAAAPESSVPVAAGSLTFTVNVNMVYESR